VLQTREVFTAADGNITRSVDVDDDDDDYDDDDYDDDATAFRAINTRARTHGVRVMYALQTRACTHANITTLQQI